MFTLEKGTVRFTGEIFTFTPLAQILVIATQKSNE